MLIIIIAYLMAAAGSAATSSRRVMGALAIMASSVSLIASVRIAYKVSVHGAYTALSFISVDALGALVILIVAVVAWFVAIYSIPYISTEYRKKIVGHTRVKQYFILFNLFILAMLLSTASKYPILSWILLEATTLSTAFLISYYNKPSTIEAAWKYLIINSVGLLLGLLGTLLYFTSLANSGGSGFVSWQTLAQHAGQFNPALAKMAFVFVLIGYGTKAGLSPMHTWLPDAHSKAPAPISALMSAVLLNVAFVLTMRFKIVTDLAAGHSFSQHLLIIVGLLSVMVASLIMFTARNFKRLLAYSSIENMGIIALGIGFGGLGIFGALLHMFYHAFIKSALFLTSGSLLLKYSSAKIRAIRGTMAVVPLTSVAMVTGILAITGTPPFGTFISKIYILTAGLQHFPVVSIILLATTVVVFIGLFKHANAMVLGAEPAELPLGEVDKWLAIPPLALLIMTLIFSFYLPHFLRILFEKAAGGL